MSDAPKQDWAEYERRCREANAAWVRGLSTADRFALYADLYRIVRESRCAQGDWRRLEEWNWNRKVADRRRVVTALLKLDQYHRERATEQDAG